MVKGKEVACAELRNLWIIIFQSQLSIGMFSNRQYRKSHASSELFATFANYILLCVHVFKWVLAHQHLFWTRLDTLYFWYRETEIPGLGWGLKIRFSILIFYYFNWAMSTWYDEHLNESNYLSEHKQNKLHRKAHGLLNETVLSSCDIKI